MLPRTVILFCFALSLSSTVLAAGEEGGAVQEGGKAANAQLEADNQLADLVTKAFKAAQTEELPLSPSQIQQFKGRLDSTAEAIFPSPAPKMVNRSQNVTLEPGALPTTVRLAAGYTSTLLVVDSTGQPWPITTVTVGNDKWFSVKRPETGANNLLTINPLKNHVTSNLVVTLQNQDAPLIIQLIMDDATNDKKAQEADMVVSMRMNKAGPNAAPPVIGAKIDSTISTELMSVLDGLAPAGAKPARLRNPPDGVMAWELRGNLYLRTPYPARWPAHIQQASSSSGLQVYVMPKTNKIILAINGDSFHIDIE